MMDPDKKVEKDKAKYSYVYQSSQQPFHFENEGGEYIEAEPNRIEASTGIIEYNSNAAIQ